MHEIQTSVNVSLHLTTVSIALMSLYIHIFESITWANSTDVYLGTVNPVPSPSSAFSLVLRAAFHL